VKPRTSKNGAITLLKITVVIAITVVLAAFLMAPLGRAQDQAKASLCANNMRQLLAGRQAWVAENDGGTIPPPSLAARWGNRRVVERNCSYADKIVGLSAHEASKPTTIDFTNQ
jgi:type II secretory pathway pseudopilin PulG